MKHKPLPKDDASTVEKAIRKIRYSQIEHLYFFKRGKQIRRFEGEYSNVAIDNRYLIEIKDSIIVHNHPQGASFSIEDVMAIIKYDAKMCYLVTEKFIYKLVRPSQGWSIQVTEIEFMEKYNVCKEIAEAELGKFVAQHIITQKEKDVEIIHYIWLFFFTQLNNISYEREKNEQF